MKVCEGWSCEAEVHEWKQKTRTRSKRKKEDRKETTAIEDLLEVCTAGRYFRLKRIINN